jgi:inhibitor of KinA
LPRGQTETARFLPAGDTALVVEFGSGIDRALNERVIALAALVDEVGLPGVVEAVPTFRSLLVHYDPLVTDGARLSAALSDLLLQSRAATRPGRLFRLPACYAPEYAPDLDYVARRTELTTDEVVRLHSDTKYQVYMIGFLLGYAYMGDLPAALDLPRRDNPRVRVPAGSVAVAQRMTGIYPTASPGGWHLIGMSPVRLFDLAMPTPSLLAPGDAVRFEPVTAGEFGRLKALPPIERFVLEDDVA